MQTTELFFKIPVERKCSKEFPVRRDQDHDCNEKGSSRHFVSGMSILERVDLKEGVCEGVRNHHISKQNQRSSILEENQLPGKHEQQFVTNSTDG